MIAAFTPAPEDLRALDAPLAARSELGRAGPWSVSLLFAAVFGWTAGTTDWRGGALWPAPAGAALGALIAWAFFRLVGRPAVEAVPTLQSRLACARARRADRARGVGFRGTSLRFT